MTRARLRVAKELDAIKELGLPYFRHIQADVNNILLWKGLLVPDIPPYDKGAFWIEISYPCEYPLMPPQIRFQTKIYHPNVDEMGQLCLSIISTENWNPKIKVDQVIRALIELVKKPELDYPLRLDVAKEYKEDYEKFLRRAEDHTCNFSEKRPCE